ncbi:Transcription factor MADS-box superfamily [Arabidopsis thaliana x Arabidopsis arenosa]|uniref:Transcription factor MADS-box superfamily n=1 Tax=Arabidopsis thaliana x Arabidopsis arenosa TaxID=1240361 RepID=A0A8T1Z0A9_9BRAS|nr:Transcription factor MADS-box superfamily [Arabidopsis thaliana x Arabidopsis arenosa]
MGMKKVKLSLIANERSRKPSFMKRKNGVLKKLNELSTLCGVQACALIYSPYQSVPESWPSTKGAKEVASKFMEMPSTARAKKMMSQETYLMERITKAKEQLKNLVVENRESQRVESSSVSPFPTTIGVVDILDAASPSVLAADMTPSFVADASPNINNVQYQAPYNLFDQIQQGSYNMNINQDYSNYNLNLNLNMNSNQQQSFMNRMVEQQMGYAGGRASIPFMDGNHYNYHQLPVVDLVSTSYMPSITTTTGVYDPYINNNL